MLDSELSDPGKIQYSILNDQSLFSATNPCQADNQRKEELSFCLQAAGQGFNRWFCQANGLDIHVVLSLW